MIAFWIIYGLHWFIFIFVTLCYLLEVDFRTPYSKSNSEKIKEDVLQWIHAIPKPIRKPITMSFIFFPFIMIPLAMDIGILYCIIFFFFSIFYHLYQLVKFAINLIKEAKESF